MGLFDFVANIGRKLFQRPDEAAPKIKHEISEANLDISDLEVEFEDGMVTLSGRANTQDAFEKAVLLAGNIQGVTFVNTDRLQKPPASSLKVEYYVIEKGDNLSKIAERFLGDANRYNEIFNANREVIRDADLIYPGQKIRIPVGSEESRPN